MSHNSAQSQTMHGYGTQAESPTPAATDDGRVVKHFPWASALPAEMLARFTREVTTVARLRHPHMVQVHAADRFADGTPYVVMERLRGRTLEQALEGGPVPAADLAPILRGIASALSAAHAAGVVHGGLRADTVFLAEMPGYRWGFPKLVDFGIARLGAAGQVDARADQRALVALAARALGRPFPPAVQGVLEQATSADAQQPFASVTSFIETLEEALAVAAVGAVAAPAAAAPTAATPAAATPPSSLTQQFFAEGEKQDLAHAAEDGDVEQNAPAASVVARVPRNRAQMATVTGLAIGAVGIMVATLVSLSTARDASPPAPVVVERPADVPATPPRPPAAVRTAATRASVEPSPTYRERSHQGRTAAPRARLAEPPTFIPSPAPRAAAPTPAVPVPAPAPAPAPEAAAPAAVPAPASQAPAPAAAPTPTAAEDSSAAAEEDDTQPQEQSEGEGATTQ